jgi:hypothetical protein
MQKCEPLLATTTNPSSLRQRSAFVIMPFSSTASATSDEWLETYELIFQAGFNAAGYECERAHPETGSLVKTIVQKIQRAHIVLADITDHNPNVFYELGVRHALSKRTIIVAQRSEFIPSDLRGYWAIVYSRTPKGVKTFIDELRRIVALIEQDPERSDNPVSDYMEQQNLSLLSVARAENVKRLTALYTELTGNQIALDRAAQSGLSPEVLFTGCLALLLETLYIDPGPQVLGMAYELRQHMTSLQAGKTTPDSLRAAQSKTAALKNAVIEIREKMMAGSFQEPSNISVMVWESAGGEDLRA